MKPRNINLYHPEELGKKVKAASGKGSRDDPRNINLYHPEELGKKVKVTSGKGSGDETKEH